MKKYTSLKQADRAKDDYAAIAEMPKGPRYPWGTSLRLDLDTLKKLGMDIADIKAGGKYEIHGTVEVTGTNVSTDNDGKMRGEVNLQLTECCLDGGEGGEGDDGGESGLKNTLRGILNKSRRKSNGGEHGEEVGEDAGMMDG